MVKLLPPLLFLALCAQSAAAQAPATGAPAAPARPERQQVDTVVLAMSASTAGRFLFWIAVPGSPPEGTPFTVVMREDFGMQASVVVSLLSSSYHTRRPVRIYYYPTNNPEGVGSIVRVDTIREGPG